MSGTEKADTKVDLENPLYTFGDFFVAPATFYATETGSTEQGYAVVWSQDNVTQMLSNNVPAAVNFAMGAHQSMQMVAAYLEQLSKEDDTSGLMSDTNTDDELDGVLN